VCESAIARKTCTRRLPRAGTNPVDSIASPPFAVESFAALSNLRLVYSSEQCLWAVVQ
jgi:hypothetical protein